MMKHFTIMLHAVGSDQLRCEQLIAPNPDPIETINARTSSRDIVKIYF